MFKTATLSLLLALVINAWSFAGDPPDVVAVLHAWEQATEGVPAPLADVVFDEYRDSHSAHELELAAELYGAVDARRLIEDFAWMAAMQGERLVLHAVPRDELMRLFCPGVDVEFDAGTATPRLLRFHDEAGPKSVVLTRPASEEPAVTRTAARPVPTATVIRLAAGVSISDIEDASVAPSRLSELLDRWAAATRQIKQAKLKFNRFTYDTTYFTETRSRGRFRFQSPDRGCYELFSVDENSDLISRRKGPHGEGYTVSTEPPVTYFWADNELILIHPDSQSYQVFDIPEEFDSEIRTVGSWDRAWTSLADPQRLLPGVVDVHSRDFLDDFSWSLLNQTDERITLKGTLRTDEGRYELAELQVILDARTFRTVATRTVAPNGARETVHVFDDADYNSEIGAPAEWLPDLSGFTHDNPAPPAPAAADGEAEE